MFLKYDKVNAISVSYTFEKTTFCMIVVYLSSLTRKCIELMKYLLYQCTCGWWIADHDLLINSEKRKMVNNKFVGLCGEP